MSLAPGTHLGPYEVGALLGRGGMGEVYQAADRRLHRQVALKVLPRDLVADHERRRRFLQEAQLASSLQHPHIVTIFDIGAADDGSEYLAMELVKGRTLDALIPQKGLRLSDALRYAIQITDALAAAHAAGIVHRDLKPGNIMVTDQGQIKILDFGLATLTETATPLAAADETRAAAVVETGAGMILGTVAYMSPEQAEGQKVDARSDIFSFGAILYEMLSGQRAFKANSMPGTLAAVINLEPPPLATVAPETPQPIERLVSRCLRKDMSRRAQHASDIKLMLEEFQEDSTSGSVQTAATAPVAAVAAAPRRFRVNLLAIGGALVAVLAAAAAYVMWRPSSAPPTATSFVPVTLTSLPGTEGSATFSPDGSQVAFFWQREGAAFADVYVQLIGGSGTPLRLTNDDGTHSSPSWSPDGRAIAFWHAQRGGATGAVRGDVRLVLVSPLGGPERQILEWNGVTRRMSWSPDGRWLAVSPSSLRSWPDKGITVVSPVTGERIEWASLDKSFAGSLEPAFSPDGRRIAFVRPRDDFSSDVYVVPVGADMRPAGPATLVPGAGQEGRLPVWTADGEHLLLIVGNPTSNGAVVRVRVDSSEPAERLTGLERPASIALSRDGTRLVLGRGGTDGDIWRIDIQNPAASGPIARSTLHEEGADYSPDGKRIVFSSNRLDSREIWVSDVTGENAIALTQFGGPVPGSAKWSPDGRQIVFDARPAGNSEVFAVPAGGGAVQQLTRDASEDARPVWSPDGRWIYFSSTRTGRNEIWRMAADGTNPVQVTKGGGLWITVSRDGEWVYHSESVQPFRIHRVRPDGSGDTVLVSEPTLVMAATRNALWFVPVPRPGETQYVLRALGHADGIARDVARLDFRPSVVGMTVSPDERSVLVTRPDSSGTDLLLVDGFR